MRPVRPRARSAGLLLALAALPAGAAAQGLPGGLPGGGPVDPPIGGITVTVSPDPIVFSSPTDVEFNAGRQDNPQIDVTVDAGGARPWTLYLVARSTGLQGATRLKPLTDLLFFVPVSAAYTTLVPSYTTPQYNTEIAIASGNGTQTVGVRFRLLLDYAADTPDAYDGLLEFSAR